MAEPTPYTVTYDFSGFQASNPTTPLPAAELDNELDAIAASIASLIAAAGDIRRSDGHLQNGLVTYESLDAQVQTLLGGAHSVTVPDLSPTALANEGEAAAGLSNDKLMTPLRTSQQLDALRTFSSQAAAQAGAEETTVMSPLRVKNALDALRAFADQTEANAGVITDKVMSPATAKEAVRNLRPLTSATASLTWSEIADGDSAQQDITVNPCSVGDKVVVGYPAAGLTAKVIPFAWVSASNTVTLRLTNLTGGANTPPAGSYKVTALRF